MGRVCGECSVCCKLEYIAEIDKPAREWCPHCKLGGEGRCSIYNKPERPPTCNNFRCMWLDNPDMLDDMRPDRSGMYAVDQGDHIKVVANEHKQWWRSPILDHLQGLGKHIIVTTGLSLHFICGKDKKMPRRLFIDWIL